MSFQRAGRVAALLCLLSGCASQTIRPDTGVIGTRPIDEPCRDANATFSVPVKPIRLDPLAFAVPSRWQQRFTSINDVDFSMFRVGAELNVWKGASFAFPPVLPLNTAQCEIERDGSVITIRTTVITTGVRSYRVDVSWSRMVQDQYVYMQLHTRFPEHLQQIRAVIESVRFPELASTER